MRSYYNQSLRGALLGSAALVVTVLSSSGALAQSCVNTPFQAGGLPEIGQLAAATASSVATSLASLNSVFLTQQTSAFVAAPSGVAPGTQGGGVWVRGVGGESTISSNSTTQLAGIAQVPGLSETGTINCASRERIEFAGIQVGRDISRLNLMGYNVHIGTTAGYLEAKSKEKNGPGIFENKFEVPFAGIYGVVTKDRFFADLNLRTEFYNMKLRDPTLSLFDQDVTAMGFSASVGAGYNMALWNGWFIEPSGGGIFSWTKIDQFSSVGLPETPPGANLDGRNISGTLSFDTVTSAIGRGTLRVGRNFTAGSLALQPFVTASVFRDFGADVKSRFQSCPNCVFAGGLPAEVRAQTQTSRVGTYGQFSAGVAGQLLNTGWVGFVRGDYRTGDDIEGWTANGGIRYQFTPQAPITTAFSKGPQLPVAPPIFWTGFYMGGFFGGAYGTADVGFTDLTSVDSSVAGWLGGGQVGYDYQFGAYVVGIEGDFGATNITGSETCGSANGLSAVGSAGAFSPFFMTCGSELDWIATAAARFGVTWERALFYVKAGAAWAEETMVVDCIVGPFNVPGNARQCRNPAGALVNHLEASDTRVGWMVGYGSEFSLTPNWSAKAEFKYMDFGSQDYTASDGSRLTSDLQVSTVTVGVNYRFSSVPLLAGY